MNRTALLALLLASALGASAPGCEPSTENSTPAELAAGPPLSSRARAGQQWFGTYCAACHGPAARGDGPAGMALDPPPPDLTGIAERRQGRFDEAEVSAYIDGSTRPGAHGSSQMPVWGARVPDRFGRQDRDEPLLSRDVVSLLVTYLREIQSQRQT